MKNGFIIVSLFLLLSLTLLACGCTQPVSTSVPAAMAGNVLATSQDIRDFVDNATLFAQKNGRQASIAMFNNKTGQFVAGNVSIYAFDYAGNALALPFQPGQVGENFLAKKDASGIAYTQNEVRLAQQGGGYILYHYPPPNDNSSARFKIGYVRPIDNTYWIGADVNTSEDRLIDPTLRKYVNEAKAYAIAQGEQKALTEFNNPNGSFIRGDLYVFAYDYNGTVLAWPYRPDQIGQNRINVTDPLGTYHIREMIDAARRGNGLVDYYSVNPATNETQLKISYITDVDGTWLLGAGRYMGSSPVVLSE